MQILYTVGGGTKKKSLILFGFLADNGMFELDILVYIVEGDAYGGEGGCFDDQWLCVYSQQYVVYKRMEKFRMINLRTKGY